MKLPSHLKQLFPLLSLLLLGASLHAAGSNLVANGSFESSRAKPGIPDDWTCAGNPVIKQTISQTTGRDGKPCAKLECTEFSGGSPDSHVMLCQIGKVGVRRGQWYQLTFWAKAERIKSGAVDVGLSDTKLWRGIGLSQVFTPSADWRQFTMVFQAKEDLAADASRLQFWFAGTGRLWMADVEMVETTGGVEWFPQIPTDGIKNFIPNSSFECGTGGWGSLTFGLPGWGDNLFKLEGVLDSSIATHGRQSLRISLSPQTLPVFYFDYYKPVRLPVRQVLAANRGWFVVKPGEPLTLSASLRADVEGVSGLLVANQAPERPLRKQVTVGKEWSRHEFTFRPTEPYLFIAVGLDLAASGSDSATIWVDAVQLERGDHATTYEPRLPVETSIDTGEIGNTFTNAATGLSVRLHGFNNTDREQVVRGELMLTNFFDQPVFQSSESLALPARGGASRSLTNLCPGTNGYFNASWSAPGSVQWLRCAVIQPLGPELVDSPLGFNHAYPWDFMVKLARQAGICWWRDWSAKWETVEPKQGHFSFNVADTQIRRVLNQDSQVEVLLPFPSALWSTSAKSNEVDKAAGNDTELKTRLPVAYAPRDLNDFGRYAATVASRYAHEQPRRVTYFQILNEPVFTDYALPRQFGYSLDDYLRLLDVAHAAIKQAQPDCQVVGGNSTGLDAALTHDFVAKGGLRYLDVFDLHMYDPARPVESFDDSFAALASLIQTNGGPKPVWITEWGCYADDDLPCSPPSIGDETMNRCRWASEREATEHIVKFTATSFAYGARKIFFHAGSSGTINGPDAGGVLFEYGGTPRRMFPGVAALTRLLGTPDDCVARVQTDSLRAYIFRTQGRFVAVCWRVSGADRPVNPPAQVQAFDIMGNPLAKRAILTKSPVYLRSTSSELIRKAIGDGEKSK